MDKQYKFQQHASYRADLMPVRTRLRHNKKILFKLISLIGVTVFTSARVQAQCATAASVHAACHDDGINQVYISHYSGTTINQDGYVDNRNTDAVDIQTSENELNGTLNVTNEANAGDLTLNVRNKNIKNISATNSGQGGINIQLYEDMVTSDGTGIAITNNHSATNLKINTQAIHSNSKGINAVNNGSGATVINANREIISYNGEGIYAVNNNDTTDLTIQSAAINAKQHAIYAQNNGHGLTKIDAQQQLTAQNGNGIYAQNGNTTTGLSIHTKEVNGGQNGVYAQNNGSGTTTISADGQITAINGDAVHAENQAATTDLNIHTQDVRGKNNAIYSINNGSGATDIHIAGNAVADNGNGIYAFNHGTNLTIQAQNINGVASGVYALNNGSGLTKITTTGLVETTNGDAIHVQNEGRTSGLIVNAHQINSQNNGIYSTNNGLGDTIINVDGDITANTGSGISAQNLTQSEKLTISAHHINANQNGIYAINNGSGSTSITTTGNIVGKNTYGIRSESSQQSKDTIIKQSSGTISGAITGISVINQGQGNTDVTVNGKVNGGSEAGILINGKNGAHSDIILNRGSDVAATSNVAIQDYDDNANVVLNNGSKVSGQILLGNGSDTLTINPGADITALTMVDGGDDTSPNDGMVDTLNINQSLTGSTSYNYTPNNGRAGDIAIRNWENINVDQQSTLTLSGDLNTNQLSIAAGSMVNLISTINQASITGNVNNAGSISLGNNQPDDSLKIIGHYVGQDGRLVLDLNLNTETNNRNDIADRLIVTGNTSGHTFIDFSSINGLGAATKDNGIELVNVGGQSTDNAFSLVKGHVDSVHHL